MHCLVALPPYIQQPRIMCEGVWLHGAAMIHQHCLSANPGRYDVPARNSRHRTGCMLACFAPCTSAFGSGVAPLVCLIKVLLVQLNARHKLLLFARIVVSICCAQYHDNQGEPLTMNGLDRKDSQAHAALTDRLWSPSLHIACGGRTRGYRDTILLMFPTQVADVLQVRK